MRHQRRTKILLVVLLVILVPLLQRAYVQHSRSKALASVFEASGEHICHDHTEETAVKLEGLLQADPAWTEARLMLAETYGISGDKENEEKHYRLAVKYAPRNSETHSKLGEFLMFSKRYEEAVRVFRSCLSLDHRSIEARENLARCLEHSGQLDSALKVWREVLSRDPQSTPADKAIRRLEQSSRK